MSLLGQGALAIWNDVAAEGRDEFYEWHDREHMPERVAIPGFLRGRRYRAIEATPQYFTLYEAVSTAVLAGPHYVERLNNPTPLTRRIIPNYFRNMMRGVCDVRFSAGVGEGGYIVTLRFAAVPGCEVGLERRLADALPAVAEIPMAVGAHLCIADAGASTIETVERRSHGAAVPGWLIMIEGATADGAIAACDALLAHDLPRHGAQAGVQRGLYQLEFALTKR